MSLPQQAYGGHAMSSSDLTLIHFASSDSFYPLQLFPISMYFSCFQDDARVENIGTDQRTDAA